MRSASTTRGTPPKLSRHSASILNVVSAVSSVAKRTKRHRLQADTAQKMCSPASEPQSMMSVSPGDHTPGRRGRW
jgi:hypothetical protein